MDPSSDATALPSMFLHYTTATAQITAAPALKRVGIVPIFFNTRFQIPRRIEQEEKHVR
jgi:hypothetical protein